MDVRSFTLDIKTATLIPIIDDPSIMWARVKHLYDRGFPPYQFVPDAIKLNGTGYSDQKGNDIPWENWWQHTKEINVNNPGAWEWFTTLEVMLFNKDGALGQIDPDFDPKYSALCQMCGGNLVGYKEETNTHIKLLSYQWDMDISTLTALSPLEHPELYWYGCAVNSSGVVRKLTNGITVIVPQVARGEKWIRKSEVTLLTHRPDIYTFSDVLMP